MPEMNLRLMRKEDRIEVAELICVSTNYWYQARGKPPIFSRGPESTMLFCDVYEALDGNCCVIAEHPATKRIMGSCFFHPRPTHVSLGIMNVHPNYFGRGVAGALLRYVNDYAGRQEKPVRLVSSAMNLDSFSLYTRAGFVPQAAFQDMYLRIPEAGMAHDAPGLQRVRDGRPDDVEAMAALEKELAGIERPSDFAHFIRNPEGIWHTSILENDRGGIDGFLVSVNHPASNMLGPGIARTDTDMLPLIFAELNHNAGRTPVFLIPVDHPQLVQSMYAWGATNCEIHFLQVRGPCPPIKGVMMPTFMPETA